MSGVQVPAGASDSSAVVAAPPQQQQEHLQEVTVVTQFSPEAADGIKTSEIVLTPPQQQQQQHQGQEVTVTQVSLEAVDEIIRRYKAFPWTENDYFEYLRGWFMLLATVTASITYSAALNPPGGVWQDDDPVKGHVAGDPVLRDKRPNHYTNFYIWNLMSFVSSLFIIAILSIPQIFNKSTLKVCNVLVVLDIFSLMGALIAGSARCKTDYVNVGMSVVLVFVAIIIAKFTERALAKCGRVRSVS